jgi:hypothetical protein
LRINVDEVGRMWKEAAVAISWYHPSIFLVGLKKFRIHGAVAEIQTEHLLNTKLERCMPPYGSTALWTLAPFSVY